LDATTREACHRWPGAFPESVGDAAQFLHPKAPRRLLEPMQVTAQPAGREK